MDGLDGDTSVEALAKSGGEQRERTRKRGRNSKNGCHTCKIRRKRCDGSKPACMNCRSYGWDCDFPPTPPPSLTNIVRDDSTLGEWKTARLQSPSFEETLAAIQNWPKLLNVPSFTPLVETIDLSHFEYFRFACIQDFAVNSNPTFWKTIVTQAIYSEPFVLHASLVIGALRRPQLEGSYPTSEWDTISNAKYCLKHYIFALNLFRQRLSNGVDNSALAILGSLLFLAIEVLQGDESSALTHFESAIAVINDLANKSCYSSSTQSVICHVSHSQTSWSNPQPKDSGQHQEYLQDLIASVTSLSLDRHIFHGLWHSNTVKLPEMQSIFSSTMVARTALNFINNQMYALFWHCGPEMKTLPFKTLPEPVAVQHSTLQESLSVWLDIFEASFVGEGDFRFQLSLGTLRAEYLVSWIKLATYFFRSQTVYDSYLDQFKSIVELTSAVIQADNNSPWLTARGPCYTLDIAPVRPLYFVARYSRDPTLRRCSIESMRKVGRKGLYTGRSIAKVAEWIVKKEEVNMDSFTHFVEEQMRLHEVTIEFNRHSRMSQVWATRQNADGTWEHIDEQVDIS